MRKFMTYLLLGLLCSSMVCSCVEEEDLYQESPVATEIDPGGDLDDPAEPDEED